MSEKRENWEEMCDSCRLDGDCLFVYDGVERPPCYFKPPQWALDLMHAARVTIEAGDASLAILQAYNAIPPAARAGETSRQE